MTYWAGGGRWACRGLRELLLVRAWRTTPAVAACPSQPLRRWQSRNGRFWTAFAFTPAEALAALPQRFKHTGSPSALIQKPSERAEGWLRPFLTRRGAAGAPEVTTQRQQKKQQYTGTGAGVIVLVVITISVSPGPAPTLALCLGARSQRRHKPAHAAAAGPDTASGLSQVTLANKRGCKAKGARASTALGPPRPPRLLLHTHLLPAAARASATRASAAFS